MAESIPGAAAIKAALLAWKREGVARPLIPMYADADGDGEPDFYGLDDNEQVVHVSGVTVADTVARSDGSGIEQKGSRD